MIACAALSAAAARNDPPRRTHPRNLRIRMGPRLAGFTISSQPVYDTVPMAFTFASNFSGTGTSVSLPVALIVGAGLVISVVATQTVQKNARGDAQAAFELTAEQAIDALEDRVNEHIQLTQ